MVAPSVIPAIRQAVKTNELGTASPYCLSYARKGQSGASFGFMQGDTDVNPLARDTFKSVLVAAGLAPATVAAYMAAVTKPLPNGNPFNAQDTATINAALASAAGQPLVDAMDDKLLQVVLGGVDMCNSAASARAMTIAPLAQVTIAPWVNMTGAPTTLAGWIGGKTVAGLAPPAPPMVQAAQIETYLKAQTFFVQNPKNFQHYSDSVAAGAKLLPVS